MLSGKVLFCVILVAVWHEAQSASLPLLRLSLDDNEILDVVDPRRMPAEMSRARVREGVPPPLCAGRCASPPRGPVCAFDAAGTARTFATLCELEAVSCRESTYRILQPVPPPLCQCVSSFNAADTARTFATVCELHAVSCRESTYYAITGLGEC